MNNKTPLINHDHYKNTKFPFRTPESPTALFWLTKVWISCTTVQSYCYSVCVHMWAFLLSLVHTLCLAQLYLRRGLWNTNFALISCAVLHLYCYPVSVHLYCILSLLVILMFRLVEYTLCSNLLYDCTVILLSSLCTPVWHFVIVNTCTVVPVRQPCLSRFWPIGAPQI